MLREETRANSLGQRRVVTITSLRMRNYAKKNL